MQRTFFRRNSFISPSTNTRKLSLRLFAVMSLLILTAVLSATAPAQTSGYNMFNWFGSAFSPTAKMVNSSAGDNLTANVAAPRDCAASTSPYEAGPDFTIGANPNCEFSYGNTATNAPTSTFALYPLSRANEFVEGVDRVYRSDSDPFRLPAVLGNRTGGTVQYADVEQESNQLNVHPGANGERSVVRFTAPTTGAYNIAGDFEGISTSGTSSDAVILNRTTGTVVFGPAPVIGTGTLVPFNQTVSLTQGDIIEFSVGDGGNGFNNDSTGLTATISMLPPQTSVVDDDCFSLSRLFR
jgi:hypothetical protein